MIIRDHILVSLLVCLTHAEIGSFVWGAERNSVVRGSRLFVFFAGRSVLIEFSFLAFVILLL